MLFVLMPLLAWFYKMASDYLKNTYLDYYLHLDAILAVANGVLTVALCVFFGIALRYFTFKIFYSHIFLLYL
jgi:hypothetical protein